jgi:2-oxoglutarate ferredoxin oxidoreductase subunit beta
VAQLQGAVYVARGTVNSAGHVSATRRMLRRAFQLQAAGVGFTFVEILTMCPTGWFIETTEAPDYLEDKLAAVHELGVLKDVGPNL